MEYAPFPGWISSKVSTLELVAPTGISDGVVTKLPARRLPVAEIDCIPASFVKWLTVVVASAAPLEKLATAFGPKVATALAARASVTTATFSWVVSELKDAAMSARPEEEK